MTDLNAMTKAAINALLVTPLTASQLKKINHADLVAMFDAMPAVDALEADLRDTRTDGTPPTPDEMLRDESNHFGIDPDEPTDPTLGQVINGLTDLEKRVIVAHADACMHCNGAETIDAMVADNMTWSDVAETAKRTGLTKKQVNGVLSSFSTKGLLITDCEPVNGEGAVQQYLTDFGIAAAFELMANGIEAKAAPKPAIPKAPKATPKANATRKPGADCILFIPADSQKEPKAGSKRAAIIDLLRAHTGTTVEDIAAATGWSRAVAGSALYVDVKGSGWGVERIGGRLHLLPQGVK